MPYTNFLFKNNLRLMNANAQIIRFQILNAFDIQLLNIIFESFNVVDYFFLLKVILLPNDLEKKNI